MVIAKTLPALGWISTRGPARYRKLSATQFVSLGVTRTDPINGRVILGRKCYDLWDLFVDNKCRCYAWHHYQLVEVVWENVWC